jgi:PAS domain S-box-containing protein
MAGAVAAVIAFGFVSISIRMDGGGSGWPLHDALHPLLGLLMGPVYGPMSSVVGATMSEAITPYTALNGLSPLLGGVSALTTALLVRGRRAWWGLWTVALILLGGLLAVGSVRAHSVALSSPEALLSAGMLLLTSIPSVRTWARRHLDPSEGDWRTAQALYAVSLFGSTVGLLVFWAGGLALGTDPFEAGAGVWFLLERVLLPLLSVLLGMALWPALQRRLFSVANQLRYGLPLFIVATFFFAGRLFMERAYTATQTQTRDRLHEQTRTAARTLTTELDRAEELLRLQARTDAPGPSASFFHRIEYVSAPFTLPPTVRSLVERARNTDRPQRGLVPLPDTVASSVALVLPPNSEGTSRRSPSSTLLAYVAPSALQRSLDAWNRGSGHLYLIGRNRASLLSPLPHPNQARTAGDPSNALVNALLESPHSTAEAPHGRYGPNVIGAVASIEDLSAHVVMEQARAQAYVHVFEMLLSMAFILLLTGGGALAVGFYVSRRVVTPLDRLIDAAREVGSGDLDTRVAVEQDNELGELAATFNAMTEELSTSIQRLQSNEERLRMALDAAHMGTWNWTAESETVTWSPQTYSILGIPQSRTENLQEVFLARVHPDDRDRVMEEVESVFENETDFTIEHRVQFRDEGIRWVRLRGRVFRDKEGSPHRLSGIIMDITARKEAEHELRVAKEEAEEMSRLKSAFLANVSHEIRTPLTSIIGFAEILADEVPDAQQDQAEKIVMSGRRLMKTLDSVLDLSMIEAGEFSLQCRSFDFAEEVRQRADLLRPMAEQSDLDFKVDIPNTPTEVRLDPNCLDRILTNLVTNAIKFTEEGHIAVRVRPTPSAVILQVEDSGVGIDEAFLPDLFEAFKQESKGLQREHQGTGLGLSITKELVEMMDGEIEVDSQKGEGTLFTVRLPYQTTGAQEPILG